MIDVYNCDAKNYFSVKSISFPPEGYVKTPSIAIMVRDPILFRKAKSLQTFD